MYLNFFHLKENPFTLTPDPHFLFMSKRHREALAHLVYGISENGGFLQLTGEVGTGKTTLCRSLLVQAPAEVDVALILNPKQTATELVASVCEELHILYPQGSESTKVFVDVLNRHLLRNHAQGRRTTLIIDEAQNLSTEVLEQVRLLTNLETNTQKLLQIILIGQPELKKMLAHPNLRQLAQRITARYHLPPLLPDETTGYIRHRLEVAGCKQVIFKPGALRLVHKLSGGIPRLINTICDRSLLGAYSKRVECVDKSLVRRAEAEIMGKAVMPRQRRFLAWAFVALLVLIFGMALKLLPLPNHKKWSQLLFREKQEALLNHDNGSDIAHPEPSQMISKKIARPGESLPSKQEKGLSDNTRGESHQKAVLGGADTGDHYVSLSKLLEEGTLKTDEETSFGTLFGFWGLSYSGLEGSTLCERAATVNLRCIYAVGNWRSLRHYNRPAVLELIGEPGRIHRAVISALDEKTFTLDFGEKQLTFDRMELERLWPGRFMLFWRPPPLRSRVLSIGSEGDDVLWLRTQLDRLNGKDTLEKIKPNPRFDDALRTRIIAFQRKHALKPDGKVGEQTLIQLNTALREPTIPLLWNKGGQKG